LRSLAEVKERRVPLRLSMGGSPGSAGDIPTDWLLAAYGFSQADILSWGGSISRDAGLWVYGERYERMKNGEIDAIIDGGSEFLIPHIAEVGMRLLPLEEPILK